MTIDIKDLADGKELDGKAMEVMRGGFCGYVVFAAPAASSKPQFEDFHFSHVVDKPSPVI